MNYTNPNRKTDDEPVDWLLTSLMFSQALGVAIPEGKGVVVELIGDVLDMKPGVTKIVVHNTDGMIIADDVSDNDNLKHGNWVEVKEKE